MRSLLRSVWDEPRAPHAPPPGWRDWALAGALVLVAVIEGVLRPDLPWRWLAVLLTVAMAATLIWRRTRPLLMVAIAFLASGLAPLLVGGDPVELNAMVAVLILPFALFRWGSGREAVLGSAIILGKVGGAALLGQLTPGEALGGMGILFTTFTLGTAFRYRGRARLRELDQATLLERERLARDLHDTVAHHVSAMAIRAQAGLATAATRPDAATDALRVIEAEASRALTEMRTMVRTLRHNEPAAVAPSPRITDLEQLAGGSRAGPAVDVQLAGDLDELPAPVGAAIYRLAQESVTNARRHARHATRITIRVTADDTCVRLRVSDDGEPGHTRPAGGSGFGLVGMKERAGLLGGRCDAGPDPVRGWTVTAVLPRAGAAAA